ncbi:MAG: hypothetical protein JWL77_4111 [Chthonomonadaceae bacterium]|nr:hypothetical protein [Chthonomonadaceae bacterium]
MSLPSLPIKTQHALTNQFYKNQLDGFANMSLEKRREFASAITAWGNAIPSSSASADPAMTKPGDIHEKTSPT